MRKVFLFLLIMLWLPLSAAQAETDGDFSYVIDGGSAIITAYTGRANTLTVPDRLGGFPVTALRYCAFKNCASLSEIVLPDGLVSIGSNAFENCASLLQIHLPDSLAAIGTHAFYGCAKLAEIALPESLERVHPYAFYGCSAVRSCALYSRAALVLTDYGYSFTSPDYPQLALMAYENKAGRRSFTVTDCNETAISVSLPDGVTLIDGYAFFGCGSLTEITIPEGVIEIAYSAFENCPALTRITLPASVIKIAENAFARSRGITIAAPEGSAAQAFAEANAGNGFIWHAL